MRAETTHNAKMTDVNILKPASQSRSLGAPEKAAALLLAMGKTNAAKLLKYLDEEEIRVIARSTSDLGAIPKNVLQDLITEFSSRVLSEGGLRGTPSLAEDLLQGVMSSEQVRQIMADVRARMNEAVWPRIAEVPAVQLAQYLGKEHPQVITFVISKTSATLAAGILAHLPQELRKEIMRRLLANKLVLQPSLRLLEQVIRDDFLLKVARTSSQDSYARMADIINKLDRREMEEVLEDLSTHRPKEAKIVRGLLFTFEDISKLKPEARVILLAEIPPEKMILALRGIEGDFKEIILSAVPSRTRRIIEQELAAGAPTQVKEVAKARRSIADLALEMAERGVIELRSDDSE